MGLFRQAEQYSTMKSALELEKIRKQGDRQQAFDMEAERRRQAEAAERFRQPGSDSERLEWCVRHIEQLEAEMAELRELLARER